MALLSTSLNTLGLVLLAHACYSAHEHLSYLQPTTTPSSSGSSSSSSPIPQPSLPIDIVLETLASVFLLCLGLVQGSPALRPISWRVWAGKIERDAAPAAAAGKTAGQEINPFLGLESRVAFWDVRAKRKEFDRWVRERDGVVKT
ncbi:MAG: hypothetical protein M1816_005037 [Peltula sp. TS41687]|nr:MAG: hypothetical protein M1816_005037 [Peltula sp. TS41687]